MTCGICGRTLKDSKSRERGYGPVCYRKINPTSANEEGSVSKSSSIFELDYDIPGQMEIKDFIKV